MCSIFVSEHGENISIQINSPDAFDGDNPLNEADVWDILHEIRTNLLGRDNNHPLVSEISSLMNRILELYPQVNSFEEA